VKEAKRGHLAKAKERFVKAYLLDPNDPFTLNNLGYVAELEGDADRALRYYQLAGNFTTEAVIDEATSPALKGQPVIAAFQSSQASEYQTNKANFRAMSLIEKGRVFEAELVLRRALQTDPKNPFLLDSLGYVMESEGDLQAALQYYTEAASLNSDEQVFLTPVKKWRGKPISQVAARSADAVREALEKGEDTEARVTRLNLQGVSALNHADTASAQKYFTNAYKLDPENAFTLNNLGYIDELNGDRETAEMYYEAARTAEQANERVTYATRSDAEGRKLGSLAQTNQGDVNATLKAIQERKRRVRRPVQLMVRNGSFAAPAIEELKPQSPLSVPNPPLPAPRMPQRDVTPQSAPPVSPENEPSIQLLPPDSQAQPSPPSSPKADH
jgi:Flp pilus assembly protein TadD